MNVEHLKMRVVFLLMFSCKHFFSIMISSLVPDSFRILLIFSKYRYFFSSCLLKMASNLMAFLSAKVGVVLICWQLWRWGGSRDAGCGSGSRPASLRGARGGFPRTAVRWALLCGLHETLGSSAERGWALRGVTVTRSKATWKIIDA